VAPGEGQSVDLVGAAACNRLAEIAGWTRAIHDRAYDLAASGGVPVFLGGDHSLSIGTISALARHCRDQGRALDILWLDAHADFNTPETTPSGNMHGMPLAFLTGRADLAALLGARPAVTLDPARVHLVGLRSVDPAERHALAASGIDSVDFSDIDRVGVAPVIRRILAGIDPAATHLHVSLDVDFIDPAIAPGVGTAVSGGASYREAHAIMAMLSDSGLVGSLDIVELNPCMDERGGTARLAAELAASLFGAAT
jgi:arginase